MTVVINLCTSADADQGISSPQKAENNNSFNDSALQAADDDEVCKDAFSLQQQEEQDDESEADSDDSRSEGELEGIAWEMQQLEKKFTGLKDTYKLVDRLGEGTFSSVYKALDLRHHQFDNLKWCQHQECITCDIDRSHKEVTSDPPFPTPDPTSDTSDGKGKKRKRFTEEEEASAEHLQVTLHASKRHAKKAAYVAIKRIYVTSSPIRIQNELEILALLRDADNVAHLITAFRHEDQILAVMPYEKHYDFRDFYRSLPLSQIRNYLRCLFNGLKFAHEKGIIHRDIKPANFLFDPSTGHGKVCDFGLAETFDPATWHSKCLHGLPAHGLGLPHGRLLAKPASLWQQVKDHNKAWSKMSEEDKDEHENQRPWLPWSAEEEDDLEEKEREMEDFFEDWQPVNVNEKKAKGKVGYFKPELDRRPSVRANRAGTRGFRAPEVLLKCPDQTISLDIWSVGGILLSFLTCRFPFFASSDDVEALMEIATIFGKKKMDLVAALHNRTFVTNVPAVTDPEHTSLHQLVLSLNKKIFDAHKPADWTHSGDQRDEYGWYDSSQPLYQAIDLLRKCLALDCTKRISAAKALEHEFFKMEVP